MLEQGFLGFVASYGTLDLEFSTELRRAFFAGAAVALDEALGARYVTATVRHMVRELETEEANQSVADLMAVEPEGHA